jgi:putative 4-mercaptohistidine N1-methyltranferase
VSSAPIYESSRLLDEYLLFHYGAEEEILGGADVPYPPAMHSGLHFVQRTVGHFSSQRVARGLDLGCAVGGSTFAMAEHCDEVIGLDFSHRFIEAAQTLQRGSSLRYQRLDEAHLATDLTAHAPAAPIRQRCHFEQGDAMNLRADLGRFDRVHAANLICRLPRPLDLLEKLSSLVNEGGELILATPCTWLAEFTPPDAWPAGDTFSWLRQTLDAHFSLEHQCYEPFVIRETARKFQWSQSLLTRWKRRAS